MSRIASLVAVASACAWVACASDASTRQQANEESCVEVQRDLLGHELELDVALDLDLGVDLDLDLDDHDEDDRLLVRLGSWIEKSDAPGEYVGFSLDAYAKLKVTAGDDVFEDEGTRWVHPAGTEGRDAHGIGKIELCGAAPVQEHEEPDGDHDEAPDDGDDHDCPDWPDGDGDGGDDDVVLL